MSRSKKIRLVIYGLMIAGVATLALTALPGSRAHAINKQKELVPDALYEHLFTEGLRIVRRNIQGVIFSNKGYSTLPRLERISRPRGIHYTTFSFDGFWEKRPWELTGMAGRYYDKTHKEDFAEDKTPGRWFFKVRWTTRIKHSEQHGYMTIVEMEEVMPDVHFLKYGPTPDRANFLLETRYPDQMHKIRAYAKGKFGIFKDMD